MPASSWPSQAGNRSTLSRPGWRAIGPPSGAAARGTSGAGCANPCWTPPAWAARRRFPPRQRAQLADLACLEPVAEGLHITHWTSADLARQAIADGIVEAISPAMVRRILREV